MAEGELVLARDRAVLYLGLDRSLNLPEEARALRPASPHDLRRQARLLTKGAAGDGPRYLGVMRPSPQRQKWRAEVTIDSRGVSVGNFDDPRLAAKVRDRVVLYLQQRDPARFYEMLNFPGESGSPLSPAAARAFARRLGKVTAHSRYRGVHRDQAKLSRRWAMKLQPAGGTVRYRTEREAAIAYDRAALYYEGPTAILNFPHLAPKLEPASFEALCAESQRARKTTTCSRFVGIALSQVGRWSAKLMHKRTMYYLGTFETEEEAAVAYDQAALRIKGRRLRLNFHPMTGEELRGQWFERS